MTRSSAKNKLLGRLPAVVRKPFGVIGCLASVLIAVWGVLPGSVQERLWQRLEQRIGRAGTGDLPPALPPVQGAASKTVSRLKPRKGLDASVLQNDSAKPAPAKAPAQVRRPREVPYITPAQARAKRGAHEERLDDL